NPTPFENACYGTFNQINSPSNTVTVVNGQEECYQYPFSEFEIDKLYGGTASFIQPIGDSIFNLTYDFHSTDVFAYYNAPTNIAVPDTTERVNTISLTGEVHVIPNLGINIGLYDTWWKLIGVTPEIIGGVPVVINGSNVLLPLTRTVSHFDPHIALVYRPRGGLSYRLAYGTSETFPYPGQLSGLPFFQPPSATTNFQSFLLVKNPFLNPETSNAWDIGVDKRFGNGSVLGFDLQDTIIRNVFEPEVLPPPAPGETETQTINIAQLMTQLATLKYTFAPPAGFGYSAALTAARAIPSGIPASVYAQGPAFPENNVQICGNGLTYPNNPICIPYLKGYGQLNYTWRDGTFFKLGVDYEGKNNSYFQPPFALVDMTFRRPVTKSFELQVSVQNLLNTNNYGGIALPIVNAGVPLVAGGPAGQTTYIPDLVSAPPRLVRLQARLHTGR
ncbi:MAG: TonB-dependent receptor, partial [Candidatus Eremiobacteraeota bacterium]|nr:TonB-dependent receptor [Candidatus Eremiobacteraeota bacterium]